MTGSSSSSVVSLNIGGVADMDLESFFRNRDLLQGAVTSLNDSLTRTQDRLARAGESLQRMIRSVNGLVSALMHVQTVEVGLDRGLSNLYRWSKRFGHEFAGTLDGLATSALFLKNSLAAMAAPLMQSLSPAVAAVTDRFAALFNVVNQTVARLSGASTYVAARKTADAWDSVGGRVTKAGSAIRRCISGFDQLNVLYSGLGDSAASDSKVASMFEERPIESGLAAFVDSMRALFESGDWQELGGMLGEKVNELVSHIDWPGVGKKVGFYLGGAISTAAAFLNTVDFLNAGASIADLLSAALAQVDFADLGVLVASLFSAAIETFAGFVSRFDWGLFASSAAECVNAFVTNLGAKLDGIDWAGLALRLTEGLNHFIQDADWNGIGVFLSSRVNDLFALVGTAAATFDWRGAGVSLSSGVNAFFAGVSWEKIGRWFNDTVKGVLDFAIAFLKGFDAKGFARGVEKALAKVDWAGIAAKLWELLSLALSKIGEMGWLGKLLGGLVGLNGDSKGLLGSGGGLNVLGGLFGSGASVTVGVEYEPNVPGGAAYKNGGVMKWLQKLCAPGVDTQTRVELIREGWKSVAAWVETLTGGNVDKAIGLLRFGWETLYSYVMGHTGGDVTKGVGVTQDKWKTIADWIIGMFLGGDVTKGVGITNSGFATIAAWLIASFMGGAVNKGVGLTRDNWQSVSRWIASLFMGGAVNKGISLIRDNWQSVSRWIVSLFMGGAVNKGVGITNIGFATIAAWLIASFMGDDVTKGVGITNSGFTTIAAWLIAVFMGGDVTKGVGITNSGFTTIAAWLIAVFMGGDVTKGVGITNSGFTTIAAWLIAAFMGGTVIKNIDLGNGGWGDIALWLINWMMGGTVLKNIDLGNGGWKDIGYWLITWFMGGAVNKGVGLERDGWDTIAKWATAFLGGALTLLVGIGQAKAAGGIITAGGRSLGFAAGGVIRGGAARWWNGIPRYAAGTSRAHGTMFVAGEAGPEIVGHINGRTEILNKSQLAQTMYSAVTSGMLAALRGIEFRVPAMATGSVMPYEVSAQIAKSAADIQGTLDANNEDLIQAIISVIGQQTAAIVAALQRQGAVGGMSPQQVVDYINRRSMMGLQPLKGV